MPMLTGREREIGLFDQIVDQLHDGIGHALFLTGESGIGKSSLLAALRGSALGHGLRVGTWVSREGAITPPCAPWFAVLEQLGHPIVQDIGAFADLNRDTYLFQAGQAVSAALREEARQHPILLTFDDLQWLDAASREILIQVIHTLEGAPLLIATAWRTPAHADDDFPATVANLLRAPRSHRIEVAGLGHDGIGMLAAEAGLQLPVAALRQLEERTGGNAFYVSELIRLMADRDQLGATQGNARPTALIPDSVHQVVRVRVASLPPDARDLIERAAVLPHGFTFEEIAAMVSLPESRLLDALDVALAHGFVGLSPTQPDRFTFVHQITREAMVTGGNPIRLARLHRQAADALERVYGATPGDASADLAIHYAASHTMSGAERGIPFALHAATEATNAAAFDKAAMFCDIAHLLAERQSASERARIEVQRTIALANAVRIDDAVVAATMATRDFQGMDADEIAQSCWQMAHTLNAVGAPPACGKSLQSIGLAALGDRRDLAWARLRLLDNPIALIPNNRIYAAQWLGFDKTAQQIVGQSPHERDQVLAIESFDARTPHQTRELIALARGWSDPRARLRGLTAAANDLTYRHASFRQALRLWHEILGIAQEHGAIPWEANASNQIALLHVTLGEFAAATSAMHEADAVNARLGPANDTDILHMERDFVLAHVLDGDWTGQATFWLEFAGDPPVGLDTQLAAPVYAAMAASAAATAGIGVPQALVLIDALAEIAAHPEIVQRNGVVAWAIDAIHTLGDRDRAARFDRLSADLLASGVDDYPQTSLLLSRARMLTLLKDPRAVSFYRDAQEHLAATDQAPILGIALYEEAIAPFTAPHERSRLLDQADGVFASLQMTSWRERVRRASSTTAAVPSDQSGLSARELEVLRLIARGYPDRRIADTLFISERTVHAHVRNMLQKTDTANRTELSSWASDRGILVRDTGSQP